MFRRRRKAREVSESPSGPVQPEPEPDPLVRLPKGYGYLPRGVAPKRGLLDEEPQVDMGSGRASRSKTRQRA